MGGAKALKSDIVAVDLFCGAAGLSLGLAESGIHVAAGVDLDPACRYPFEKNIGASFYERDVSDLKASELRDLFGAAGTRVLAGCAPCQPFSGYTTKRRHIDGRWQLLLEFLRLATDVRPEIVTLENVPRLIHLPLWNEFVGGLRSAGYQVAWDILDAADYGVPQKRRRVVLLASRLGEIELPKRWSRARKTVRKAIGSLPQIEAGVRGQRDPLHSSRALTERNLRRIKVSRPAGTWREWPKHMRAECHLNETGRTYPSVYGRMSWDTPSPTITTQFYGFGNGRFGHPAQNRAITLREGAILQSFPRSFEFVEPGSRISFKAIGRLIGNAVPPRLAQAVGRAIVNHVAKVDSGGMVMRRGG
jgi:DNA (cytosine-5)-methyltransferase 1